MEKFESHSAGIQGELGSFSFSAGRLLLGNDTHFTPFETFNAVFEALDKGDIRKAIIPIENTLHGSVHENYDHLLGFDVTISGETSIQICHNLIAASTMKVQDIRQVFSHPVALNQCRMFFAGHRYIEPIPFYDTAGSVKMLLEKNPVASAAIASEAAAEIYGGTILERHIEDNLQNFTRFFLLTKEPPEPRSHLPWKTSIAFSTANVPGALFKVMACFALRDLDLTKIESRPLKAKPWEYLFYLDLIGSDKDEAVKSALMHLQETTTFFKLLGSYQPTVNSLVTQMS